MRKPRDFDAELKALDDRAKLLKERKLHQLGELVAAIGADALPVDELASALLAAVATSEPAIKEDWRARGGAFFRNPRGAAGGAHRGRQSIEADDGGAPASASKAGA